MRVLVLLCQNQDQALPDRSALDIHFMQAALKLAQKAASLGEVPVGAVIVQQGKIIATGYNLVEQRQQVLDHAELRAIRQATKKTGSWRLEDCDLYVTLEPCAMCAGAITWSRFKRVVIGALDPKAGAYQSVVPVLGHLRLNHRPQVISGVMAEESSVLLKEFFKGLRKKKKVESGKKIPYGRA